MSERLCVFCEHYNFEKVGHVYYSTLTGGDETGGMSCKKFHFYEERPHDTVELRALLLRATSCPDYMQPLDTRG